MLKTVLVTGATGGLGRNAVEYLLARGVAVRATGRNATIGAQLQAAGAEFYPFDLTDIGQADAHRLAKGVDAVWHCAALSSPWGRPDEFMAANVTATENILHAAGWAGVKHFVHISTPAIYFDYKHHRDIPESYQPKRFVNLYAETKAMAEARVQVNVGLFPAMRHVTLRPRAIFGPYDQVLLPRLMRVLNTGDGRMPLPRAGKTVLDMTYVENVSHAMWLASTVPAVPTGSVFNVTNDDPQEIRAVLGQLLDGYRGRKFEVRDIPYPVLAGAARVLEIVAKCTGREPALTRYSMGALAYDMTLDITSIRKVLGYVPPVSMDEGIQRTATWMQKNG